MFHKIPHLPPSYMRKPYGWMNIKKNPKYITRLSGDPNFTYFPSSKV
jgi:hypothetical protein